MSRSSLSFKVENAKPCKQPWSEMHGNVRERHCESCKKQVHNLAAMTTSEIGKLITTSSKELCARITRRPDGSLVTLDSQLKPSVAAGVALSASLAFGAAAMAQTSVAHSQTSRAQLSGTVLLRDGSGPAVGATISLVSNDATISETHADRHGNFIIAADPGTYDVHIRQNVFFGFLIRGAELHEGEQSLQPLRTHFDYMAGETATTGTMSFTYKYPIAYAFKHPLRYLKHLPHNF